MQTTSFLPDSYLDILFANRNKKYGAYELRSNYPTRALTSVGFIMFLLFLLLLFSFRSKSDNVPAAEVRSPVTNNPVDLHRIIYSEPKLQTPPKTTNKAVKKYTTFVVKKDDEVKEPVTENKVLINRQIGAENIEGDETDSDLGNSAKIKGEPDAGFEKMEPPATSVPIRYTSVMPDFNGDLKAYLSRELKYPEAARNQDVQGRVSIEFIVNEDGAISGAKVLKGIGAGCDEEALRVVNAMPRWKPGMNNGKAVKVYVILPIVFQLN